MKTVRFKNINIKNKHKLIIAIIITVIFIYFIFANITKTISVKMTNYLDARIKKENTLLLKEAFTNLKNVEIDIDNLMNVVKNSKEEIVEVDFNIKECTNLLSNITKYMNDHLDNYNYIGYKLEIPLGILTESPILMNLGPKIPIKVEISDTALGNIKTTVKEFGINNAIIELNVLIYVHTQIIYPLETKKEITTYETLIASKLISGSVPDFYNGTINSKSETIDLPLKE